MHHFLLRVKNGIEFESSTIYHIWGIQSKKQKKFIKTVQVGDVLWFVKNNSKGLLIAVATFTGFRERILGPCIALTPSNEELGWDGDYDMEVHYTDLTDIRDRNLCSEIKGQHSIHPYNDKCKVDLPRVCREIQLSTANSRLNEQEMKRNHHMRTCDADRISGLIPKCCTDHFILVQKAKERVDELRLSEAPVDPIVHNPVDSIVHIPVDPIVQSPQNGGCIARKLRGKTKHKLPEYRSNLYTPEQCGKKTISGEMLCKGCHDIHEIYKKTGNPATGKSPHHVTWHGVMTEDPPEWSHIVGTKWASDNRTNV